MLRSVYAAMFALCCTMIFAEEPKPNAPPLTGQPAVSPAPTPSRVSAPIINIPRPPNPDWVALLDRLRIQPRAGEINNGTVNGTLTDIFSGNVDIKTKSDAITVEYEERLLEKAAKWENEMRELRAQYEVKLIAELPEGKRDAAQKLLMLSRSKWAEASERDAKTRTAFLERMRNGTSGTPSAIGSPASKIQAETDVNAWMREQRMAAMKRDAEDIMLMRNLLAPEDALRFDSRNRMRVTQPITAASEKSRTSPRALPTESAKEEKKPADPKGPESK